MFSRIFQSESTNFFTLKYFSVETENIFFSQFRAFEKNQNNYYIIFGKIKIVEKKSRWWVFIKLQSTKLYWMLTMWWVFYPLSKSAWNGEQLIRNMPLEVLQTKISMFQSCLSWNVLVLHTVEQSCSTYYHLKWGKPKTQIPSKPWWKIGYGKTPLHINHHNLIYIL